jgi:hypothetical protein
MKILVYTNFGKLLLNISYAGKNINLYKHSQDPCDEFWILISELFPEWRTKGGQLKVEEDFQIAGEEACWMRDRFRTFIELRLVELPVYDQENPDASPKSRREIEVFGKRHVLDNSRMRLGVFQELQIAVEFLEHLEKIVHEKGMLMVYIYPDFRKYERDLLEILKNGNEIMDKSKISSLFSGSQGDLENAIRVFFGWKIVEVTSQGICLNHKGRSWY